MIDKIQIPFSKFKKKLDDNSKILLSGIYGSGKTTFINNFFEKNKRDYNHIRISPVNYSVVANTDIFELIKYDILFQLIGKVDKSDFEKLDIPYQLTLYTYLFKTDNYGNLLDLLAPFLVFAGKFGANSLKVYDKLKLLKDKFSEFHKSFQIDDFQKVEEYLKGVKDIEGHIYEEDFFTELIRKLVEKLKENDETKPDVVLVIDDLDRLDPEHIFRILNIFSAHIDFGGDQNSNKFDFDKIVLIGDYANIESIFTHKYGINTDFKGYINKFFDDIHWFDSSSFIKGIIDTYLDIVDVNSGTKTFYQNQMVRNNIVYILSNLLDFHLISFRDLLNFKTEFKSVDFLAKKKKNLAYSNSILKDQILSAEICINFLITFFNNKSETLKIIEKARDKNLNPFKDQYGNKSFLDGIAQLSLLIAYDNPEAISALKSEVNAEEVKVMYNNYSFYCIYKREFNSKIITLICNKVEFSGKEIEPHKLNYFEFLHEAIKVYLDITR